MKQNSEKLSTRKLRKSRETRTMLASRFRVLCTDAGLTIDGVAKLLHVTPRTVRYWFSGKSGVPYAAYKLVRVLRWFELPQPGFEDWCMHSGKLWTPEGHGISPQDGGWWSLLVRQARCFRVAYAEAAAARGSARMREVPGPVRPVIAPSVSQWDNEPCAPNPPAPRPGARSIPDGNHGDNTTEVGPVWGQSDTITAPWPLISDSLPPLTWPLAPTAIASGSPSIASLALHLTPICNRAEQGQSLPGLSNLGLPRQGSPRSLRPLSPPSGSPQSQHPSSALSRSCRPSLARQTGPSSHSGIVSTKPSSQRGGTL